MEIVTLTLCCIIILTTLALTARCIVIQKQMTWLAPSLPLGQIFPKISVVVPARNEEHDLVDSMHSILNQKGVNLEVVIVNDHSTDQTGALADRISLEDIRVTVLHNPPMQPGWLGKVNAMQHGVEYTTGEYLLFTDADILHNPTCIFSALTVMQQNRYDFFSFAPLLLNESIWEHINIPIYFVGFIKFLSLSRLNDPASPNAIASGAFMLMKKTVFHETGGFESVKREMFDDVGLARYLKSKQYRVSYWFAPECAQVQLFKNARDAFWGTTKNILGAVEGHAAFILPLIIVCIVQYWTSLFAVIVGILTANPMLVMAGLCVYTVQYLSFFSVQRIFRFHAIKLVWFPLVVMVATCCIFRALWHQMKGEIFWRGRAIKVN